MNKEKEEPSEDKEDDEVHKARMSLWTAMQHHFSSEPIHFTGDTYPQLVKSSTRNALTVSEVAYLHSLLKSDNLDHLNCAVRRLSDHNVFVPSTTFVDVATEKTVVQPTESVRRDSFVQQHLFRLHEATNHRPSTLMRRLSIKERDRQNSIVDYGDDQAFASDTEWNSLNDVTSWLDGNQGVEVDDDGNPLPPPNPAAFRILGTSADDVSCHPHVLSPPLMEALLEFMPETLTSDYHFWLKYSMVRDGGGLFQLVKHVRASQYTVLAIETTEGHVFGAFTSQPWRISNQFYGSSNSFLWRLRHSRTMAVAATTASNQHYPNSLLEQAQLETELDVFPVATEHASAGIQGCQLQHGLALGKVTNGIDMSPSSLSSYALFLRHDLRLGHTSSSDAFKNPCLILEDNGDNDSASDHHTRKIQMFFEVANIEVWTLTPFETESEAEQAELASFFLQDEQRPLNLLSILVHGRDDRIS